MILIEQIAINASRDAIWSLITDVEGLAESIGGVDQIEILERPQEGLLGLKWRETRTVFGKTATEDMCVTAVEETESFQTTAESHGTQYITTRSIFEGHGQHTLTMTHESRPQSFMAKAMSLPLGFLFKGMLRKCILQDLGDVKAAVEAAATEGD